MQVHSKKSDRKSIFVLLKHRWQRPFSLFIFLFLSRSILANENAPTSIDHVLDLLEKKILEQENKEETESSTLDNTPSSVSKSYKFSKPAKIQTETEENRMISSFEKKASSLESQIEAVESNVNKMRHLLTQETKSDAFVAIYASFISPSPKPSYLIRTLQIKIDDLTLLHLIDGSSLWDLDDSMPIYFGPLTPGRHRISLIARMSHSRDQLQLSSPLRQELNKSFEIHVPLGSTNQRFTLEISTNDGVPAANLRES